MGRKNKRKETTYRKLKTNPRYYVSNNKKARSPARIYPGTFYAGAAECIGAEPDMVRALAETAEPAIEPAAAIGHAEPVPNLTQVGNPAQEPRQTIPFQPHRWDIWFAHLGDEGSHVEAGCRPVIVIGNDRVNRYSNTVTVVPVTTKVKRLYMPAHVELFPSDVDASDGVGLEPSITLVEQTRAVDKRDFTHYVGRLDNRERRAQVEQAIADHLGLAGFISSAGGASAADTSDNHTQDAAGGASGEVIAGEQ